MLYPTAILYKFYIPLLPSYINVLSPCYPIYMFYLSARYGVKHKTTSILIFSTLYKYFSEADYTRIRVQKNYGGSIDVILHERVCILLSVHATFWLSLSSLYLSLYLSLSRYVMLYQKTRFFVSKFPARPRFILPILPTLRELRFC